MMEKKFCSRMLRLRKDGEYYHTLSPYARVIRLNPTAAQMLLMCNEIHTVAELSAAVSEKYGISFDRALADCRSFVEDMLSCGLLVYEEN